MNNPGKYDDACTAARGMTGAETCILIVIGAPGGPGFSVQSTDERHIALLPRMLEEMAAALREEVPEARGGETDGET